MRITLIISLCVLIIAVPIVAKTSNEKDNIQQIKVGNFCLPNSQQPGPLIGFGQNIFDKGKLQLFTEVQYLNGEDKDLTALDPSILYSFTDSFSLFVRLSGIINATFNNQSFNSLENAIIQGEYAIIDKNTLTTVNMLTIVVNYTIPISTAIPHAEFTTPGLFLGLTASHVATAWYAFAACSGTIPVAHNGIKYGTQILYQGGVSRTISAIPDKWICNWMFEMNGTYTQANTLSDQNDRGFGGNSILLTPSLWFSTQHLILQFGVSWVALQNLSNQQNKDNYYITGNIGWKF